MFPGFCVVVVGVDMWVDGLTNSNIQGRAGLVAFRRHRLGVNSAGKAFYKGYVHSMPFSFLLGIEANSCAVASNRG